MLRIETGGGGGYGHPFDRPAESVLEDVLGGFVSRATPRSEHYGVAIDERRCRRRHADRASCAPSARQSRLSTVNEYVDALA